MKAFVAALCTLGVLIAVIALNAAFVHQTASALEKQIDNLEIGKEDALFVLEEFWNKKKTLIGLSASTNRIQDIDERIAEIHAAIEQKDEAELKTASHLTLVAIERLRHHERCSIDNLL